MGQDAAVIRQEIEDTRERMAGTVDALGYKADVPARAKDSITQSFTGVKERIIGAGANVADAAPDGDDARRAGQRAVGLAQENPLGLALGAAAVGFLAGMLLPSTAVENQRLGPVADQVKDQAMDTGREALDHGRQVVQDTAEAVSDAASDLASQVTESVQGAGEASADSARAAAADISDTARESAQTHAEELTDSARDHAETLQGSARESGTGRED